MNQTRDIDRYISDIHHKYSFIGDGCVPIMEIVKSYGFKLFSYEPEVEGVVSMVCIDNLLKEYYKSGKIIKLDKSMKKFRLRYVLAVQFGMFLLHKDTQPFYHAFKDGEARDDDETWCYQFASKLMLPEKGLREKYEELASSGLDSNDVLKQLVQYFQVPKSIILERVEQLKL